MRQDGPSFGDPGDFADDGPGFPSARQYVPRDGRTWDGPEGE